jgi:hypothetical protein
MDPNISYPIALNATLIQPPQEIWRDWLPIIASIAVVVLGGLITYYVNVGLERNKRQFEFKIQVYSEATEILSSSELIRALSSYYVSEKGEIELRLLKSLELKLILCNAPIELRKLFGCLQKPIVDREIEREEMIHSLIEKEIIPAMERDLLMGSKHCWRQNLKNIIKCK